jgi:hypothetical protein
VARPSAARPPTLAAPLPPPAPAAVATAPARPTPTPTPAPRTEPITVASVLDEPAPLLKSPGLFARIFSRGKRPAASPAAVAKTAASIEFTERMPKLPFGDKDGLYGEQQRATELSFPPPSTTRKAKPATKKPRRAAADPGRVCDRCWRRLDADGHCKTCG